MSPERANAIYDLLVRECDASEWHRESFVFYHEPVTKDDVHNEWRFGGKLGMGGKYRAKRNAITCYPEDSNPERVVLIERVNELLKLVPDDV